VLETIQLVLDRPRNDDPAAFVYVAESIAFEKTQPVAVSSVFHPDADPTAHRAALAELESQLKARGWQREPSPRQRRLIGVRFYRARQDA
jgi:uncharacterized protein YbjT (DUF2867 family)